MPSIIVRLVRSITPFDSWRSLSAMSWTIPNWRHAACSSGAPSEYQCRMTLEPLKSFIADITSWVVCLHAGYPAIQPVPRSFTESEVRSTLGSVVCLTTMMESLVTLSPKCLGALASWTSSFTGGGEGKLTEVLRRFSRSRCLSRLWVRCVLQHIHARQPGCLGK